MRFVLTGKAGGYLRTSSGGRYLNGAGDGSGDLGMVDHAPLCHRYFGSA
jgi:hypothetical protein